MIWITSDVDGNVYKEPFSKGILSRSLNISDIGAQKAHEIACDKALTEFEKYRVKQDKLYKSDFDLLMEESEDYNA